MTEQEKINSEVQTRLDLQDAKFTAFMRAQDERFTSFMQELQQQREDIRTTNAKIDAKFDKISEQIHTMTIAAVVGFGAIAVAVAGLIVSALK